MARSSSDALLVEPNRPPSRVAVVGLGGYAGAHHAVVARLEAAGRLRLVATCDPRAEAQTSQCATLAFVARGVRVYPDHHALLAAHAHELDLIVLPTPIGLHAAMHRDAVAAGVPVYLEKPPTLDPEELESMLAVERGARRPTFVGFNHCAEPARLALKRRLLNGEFGAPREFRLLGLWPRPERYFTRVAWAGRLLDPGDGRPMPDSCLGNALAHHVHNLLLWAGRDGVRAWADVVEARARLLRAHAIRAPDTVFIAARTADGLPLRIALSHACDGVGRHEESVVCERATVRYITRHEARVEWRDGHVERFATAASDPLEDNYTACLAALAAADGRPPVTLGDTRPFVRLHALAYLAAAEIEMIAAPLAGVRRDAATGDTFRVIHDIDVLAADFLADERWPWSVLGPSRRATCADLPVFATTIRRLAFEVP